MRAVCPEHLRNDETRINYLAATIITKLLLKVKDSIATMLPRLNMLIRLKKTVQITKPNPPVFHNSHLRCAQAVKSVFFFITTSLLTGTSIMCKKYSQKTLDDSCILSIIELCSACGEIIEPLKLVRLWRIVRLPVYGGT